MLVCVRTALVLLLVLFYVISELLCILCNYIVIVANCMENDSSQLDTNQTVSDGLKALTEDSETSSGNNPGSISHNNKSNTRLYNFNNNISQNYDNIINRTVESLNTEKNQQSNNIIKNVANTYTLVDVVQGLNISNNCSIELANVVKRSMESLTINPSLNLTPIKPLTETIESLAESSSQRKVTFRNPIEEVVTFRNPIEEVVTFRNPIEEVRYFDQDKIYTHEEFRDMVKKLWDQIKPFNS